MQFEQSSNRFIAPEDLRSAPGMLISRTGFVARSQSHARKHALRRPLQFEKLKLAAMRIVKQRRQVRNLLRQCRRGLRMNLAPDLEQPEIFIEARIRQHVFK